MDSLWSRVKRGVLYLCFLGIVVLLVKSELTLVANSRAELDHGKTTQAQVIRKRISIHGRRRKWTDWDIYYKYKVGRTVYFNQYPTSEQKYYATKIGTRFIVTYLPENPSYVDEGIVTPETVSESVIGTSVLILIITLFFAGWILINEITIRNKRRAQQNGANTGAILSQRTAESSPFRD